MDFVLCTMVTLGLPPLESTRRRALRPGESIAISAADAELLRTRFSMRELLRHGDVTLEPIEAPSETQATSSTVDDPEGDDADPWDLEHKSRDELRDIARELGLEGKVDLRLGEERLREALREAIGRES